MKEIVVKRKPFYYDAQIKRYLLQVAATAFAGFRVRSGVQRDGKVRDIDIPILMGTYDRVVGYLRGDGNMNVTPTVPILAMELSGLRQASERRRSVQHVETIVYQERQPTPISEGNMSVPVGDTSENITTKILERHSPVAYEMKISLTLWASNMEQSLQFIEQLGIVFNPEIDIQVSNSPLDWTYLTSLEFDGDFRFTRAGSEIGDKGSSEYHLVEMEFTMFIYLNPPVKVYNSNEIRKIHVQLREYEESIEDWSTSNLIDGFIIRAE